MFNKILVALDDSVIGEQVLERAISLSKVLGANLMLLHVTAPIFDPYPVPPRETVGEVDLPLHMTSIGAYIENLQIRNKLGLELIQTYAKQAKAALYPDSEQIPDATIQIETNHKFGTPGRTICDVAREWNADLIVVGRRGLRGIAEMVLGSVSNYVVHHAPCTVLLLNTEQPE